MTYIKKKVPPLTYKRIMGGVVLDLAGTCSHEIECELSAHTVWSDSDLMVVPGASEKAMLG